MSLKDRLKRLREERRAKRPYLMRQLDLQTEQLRMLRQPEDALAVGDQLPEGELLGSDGASLPVYDLLERGPLALVFFRGAWCPFCSESLLALEEVKGRLNALGYTLVAVSPDRPSLLLQQARDASLTFPLLSDPHYVFAQLCGLDFALAQAYVEQYQAVGTDLPARHGDDRWHLPIPGAFLIDGGGVVRYAYKNADPTERVEPAELLAAAEALAVQAAEGSAG